MIPCMKCTWANLANATQTLNPQVFGSGVVAEDDGDFTLGGVATDKASEEENGSGSSGSGSGAAGEAGAAAAKPAAAGGEAGMRLFLSQVRGHGFEMGFWVRCSRVLQPHVSGLCS